MVNGIVIGTGVCTLFTINSNWNSSECSWFNSSNGNLWNNQGGDFNKDDYVTTNAKMLPNEVEIFDVTKMVNEIIKGNKPNYGFILEPATTPDLSVQMQDHIYHSSEQADIGKRPALVLYDQVGIVKNKKFCNSRIEINRSLNVINLKTPYREFNVSIFDLKGREIYKAKSKDETTQIKSDSFGKGLFIIRLWNDNFSEKLSISFL